MTTLGGVKMARSTTLPRLGLAVAGVAPGSLVQVKTERYDSWICKVDVATPWTSYILGRRCYKPFSAGNVRVAHAIENPDRQSTGRHILEHRCTSVVLIPKLAGS